MLSGPGQFAENETMRSIFERSLHMCYSKYAIYILPTRSTTVTAPLRFPTAPENALKLLMAVNFLDC